MERTRRNKAEEVQFYGTTESLTGKKKTSIDSRSCSKE